MWLVVGLGNPGTEYSDTRHNVGFMVESRLRERAGAGTARDRFGGELCEGTLAGERLLFLRPMEYMNVSGQAVARTAQFYKVAPETVVVIHDDVDLPMGRLRLAVGGGAGGHNGLRSIMSHLGTRDFCRVRVGVDRPVPGRDTADHVLQKFAAAERKDLPDLIERAADAVEAIVTSGLTAAMNRFNRNEKEGS